MDGIGANDDVLSMLIGRLAAGPLPGGDLRTGDESWIREP